ncbi:hypothetical protein [Thalassospira marina]|uniref:Uncharacterized protein n=1 Tax=Thalassospira marina TaxID=2048283 RepID=A0ABM6Q8J1_9PROT|nr:hypothetical protein [Thalassospira marina]AUG52817.1 hypothetical protein CSC3H3_08935 [Thalassospira marina]
MYIYTYGYFVALRQENNCCIDALQKPGHVAGLALFSLKFGSDLLSILLGDASKQDETGEKIEL